MYYRTPENRRPRTPYPSDEVSVPENYGGSVFRRNDGKTTFSPLEEQAEEAEREYDSHGERAEDRRTADREAEHSYVRGDTDEPAEDFPYRGQNREKRPDTWEGGEFSSDGELFDGDRRGDGADFPDRRDNRDICDVRDIHDVRDVRSHHDRPDRPGCRDNSDGQGRPDCGCEKKNPDGTNTEPPSCLPKPPGFLEHFSLPQSFGSEELLLLGLMYLTAQKPDDDLWVYLLVLLFCG